MNISTTPRRLALAAMTFVCLFTTVRTAQGQNCSDFNSYPAYPALPAAQVTAVNLALDNTGNVPMTNAILNGLGFNIDFGCDYWITGAPFGGPVRVGPIFTNFTCANIGTHTFMLQAGGFPLITDDMGPGATLRALQVTVVDNIPPTITCIVNQVRNAGPSCTYTTVGAEFDWATVNDNCATNITYALTGATVGAGGATLAGAVFGKGTTTVTWTVADNAQPTPNSVSCSFTVMVNDVTPPMITCPADQNVGTNPATGCTYAYIGGAATATDNCPPTPTITNNYNGLSTLAGAVFPAGLNGTALLTTVIWTATDGTNMAMCNQNITVTDNDAPAVICPIPAASYNADPGVCQRQILSGLTAATSDNCSVATLTWANIGGPALVGAGTSTPSNVTGAIFAVGTTTIRYTVTDGVGLMSQCQFNVTVVDNQVPTIVALAPSLVVYQSAFTVNNAPGTCSQNVSWYRPSFLPCPAPVPPYDYTHCVTDNCPAPPGGFIVTELQPTMPDGLVYTAGSGNFFVDNGVTPLNYDNNNPLHRTTPVDANFPIGVLPPTVLRYQVTDGNGQSSTLYITVAVSETEAPDANCATGTVTLSLDPILNVAIATASLINNGSTDNCGIATMTTDDPSTPLPIDESLFDCSQLGSNLVTLYVTDNAGNTSTCTANVYVVDNTLPQIGCPSAFVVPAGPNCAATVPSLIFSPTLNYPPTPSVLEFYDNALDPCGLVFDYQVDGDPFQPLGTFYGTGPSVDMSGIVFSGNNSVTLRATDNSGNIVVCNFSVNVQDQTPPTYATPGNPGPAFGSTILANVPSLSSCSAKAIWADPIFVDDCPGTPVIVSQSAFSNVTIFSADNGGITPVTYVVRDVVGNLYTHTFNVQVIDTQFPVAKCKDITVNLTGAGSVVVTPANVDDGSSDNCGYVYVDPITLLAPIPPAVLSTTYTCANIGTNNYVLAIKDAAGNSSTKTCVVTVKDVTAPVLTCPSNMTVNTPLLPALPSCQGVLSGTVLATDNCTVSGYQYSTIAYPPGPTTNQFTAFAGGNLANIPAFPLGVTTVTIRATDGVLPTPNISNICIFTVTVKDVTPPVFAGVPANVTVSCDAIPLVTNPTSTDNCGTATVSYSGQTFSAGICLYTITRTWVASDNAVPPNTISTSQIITVQDVTGPVFNPAFIPTGTVNINVSGPSICTGTHTLTVVNITNITDACNGVSGIAYAIVPASGPAIPPGNLTLAAGTFTLPVTTFPIGTNVVTLTATDGCGNPTVKVVNIIVADNQPPVFKNAYALAPTGRCGQVYTLPNTSNNCDQLFTWVRPTTADISDCGTMTVTEMISNSTVQAFVTLANPFPLALPIPPASSTVVAQFPVGETTVKYTATQGLNVTTCSFIVKILDTQAPNVTCPANQNLSISSACAAAAMVPIYSPASISDNCSNNVVITQTPTAGTLLSSIPGLVVAAGSTFPVRLIAKDSLPDLKADTCTFTVTLVDGQSPVPIITNLPDITSNCTKDTVTAPSATDCNGTSIVIIHGTPSVPVMMILPPLVPGGPPRYVLNPGSYVITWSYTDPQNNTTTQPQNVFITVDVTGPVAIAQPLSVNLSALGSATVTAVQLNNGSFDPDLCGPITVSIRTGNAPNFVYVPTINLTCANLGVNVVIFAATDINGNTSTFATAVTVFDVTLPAFTNPWTMAQSNIGVLCPAAPPPATDFPQTAADQCDNAVSIVLTQTTSQTMTGCGKYSYIINRTWTATDDSGNAVTRTQHIVVQDSQVPVFAANTPATVTASTTPNSLTCTAQVTFDMAGFVSDCEAAADVTITNALISAPPGNTFVIPAGSNIGAGNYPLGTYVIRFTAKDACGNMATKDLTVVVSDATPPTAVCINGVSASLQPSGSVVVMVNQFNNFSYDNCGGALDLKIQRLDQNPLVAPSGNLTYTCADADGVTQHPVKLFVADAAGNMSMCLTYIVIQDNVAPVLTCPVAVTVDCAADKTPTALGSPTIVDNCAPGAATFTDVITAGVGTVCEVLTRTWKVIDQANNMGTCNQIINIKDTQAPTFTTTPANLAISCEDPLVVAPVLTATDNCSVGSQIVITFSEVSSQTMVGCTKYNYTTTRTWHATDKCGNTATHTQMVVVTDTKKPVFLGMPDTLEVHAASFPTIQDVCLVSVTFNAANFLVECAALNELTINSIVFQPAILPSITPTLLNVSGNYPIGSTRVIFTLTDPCGNQGKDTVVVKVIDDAVPSMACDDFTLVLGSNGEATITPNNVIQGNDGVFDNCGIDTLILSKTNFDCSNLGLNAVTLTATDNNGNENFCTVDVNVTLGNNTGFNLSATGTSESYFGADNGTGTAVATGGTGVFTYLWSGSGATTAAVNGLSAGVHTVSVSDSNSGCIAVDTVVVQAGPKVTITVGTGNGCQGATVTIPVTADNFINVSGFSFGLALSNGLVGAITSLSDVNPALVGLTPGANSVFWTHPMLTPTTLPNGTLLFNVNIQLANPPTAVGTTSGIVLSAIPALVFLQDGTNPAPLVTFNPGTVTISCPVNDLQIAGEVFTWKAPPKPVPGVTITLTGTANGTDVTALPTADYSLFVPSGANAVVTPSKSELLIKDQVAVNIGDAIRIQSHVAVETSFDNPYQWVAADINGDQKVNLVDFALIKAFVLGTSIHFPPVAAVVPPDWKFVPKVHVFMALPPGNPAAPALNPLNNPAPPSTIAHNNIVASFLDDDFVAVRNGDVTGSVNPQFSNDGGGAESVEVFKFRLDERTVQAGETVTIPFKSVDFVNAQAYQMTIAFDPEVFELQDILPGVLPGLSQGDFGTSNLADGLISTLWIGGKPMSLNDNETLFSLTFKALENVSNLSNVLHSSSDITEALAIGQGGDSMPIDFEFVSSVATGEVESKAFALYQNQPNPFTAETNISFRLPEAGRATLRVFSAEGRVVKMVVGEFAEGINSITFRKDELGSNGVFYYELETPKFSDRKKMILID